jgi:hypothetical protein
MWAALVGIILAGMFGFLPRPTKENSLLWVAAVVVGLAAAVHLLSRTHALLPREHETICNITGATKRTHFLSYITEYEQKLLHYHWSTNGRATASTGPMGSQGVPCFPADEADEDVLGLQDFLASRAPLQSVSDGVRRSALRHVSPPVDGIDRPVGKTDTEWLLDGGSWPGRGTPYQDGAHVWWEGERDDEKRRHSDMMWRDRSHRGDTVDKYEGDVDAWGKHTTEARRIKKEPRQFINGKWRRPTKYKLTNAEIEEFRDEDPEFSTDDYTESDDVEKGSEASEEFLPPGTLSDDW